MATIPSPTPRPIPATDAENVTLVADVPINLVFTRCGHLHEIAKGDRYNREPFQPGDTFELPASCAAVMLAWAYPQADNANVSPSGRDAGLIAGLRIVE
jgi:hypothetical protein